MVKKPQVKCPQCGKSFYREDGIEDVDWVHIKNRYWHKDCYTIYLEFRKTVGVKDVLDDDRWFQELKDYLWFDVQLPEIDFKLIAKQWGTFLKQGYTAKGMYLTLRYFYDVKKGDKEKANGGIGIIPFIYKDAENYWRAHNQHMETLMTQIIEQRRLKEQSESAQQIINIEKKKKKIIKVVDLDDI